MKILHFILILGLVLNTSCNNDDEQPQNPLDQLPPATQTGKQTFGCLINGKVFLPDNFGSGRPNAFYQFVDGAYTLGISANSGKDNNFETIIIGGIDIEALKKINYELLNKESTNFYGLYDINTGGPNSPETLTTKNEIPGIFKITNFDPENFIISGTFEFTVFDNEGNEIKITDGRFDMLYTN